MISYVPKFGGSYYILLSFLAKLALDIYWLHPPKFNIAPEKWMVGRLVSFWEGLFSGAMLNFQGVCLFVAGCFSGRSVRVEILAGNGYSAYVGM